MKPKHQLTIGGKVILAELKGTIPLAIARGKLAAAVAAVPGARRIHAFQSGMRHIQLIESGDGRFYDINGKPADVVTPSPRR